MKRARSGRLLEKERFPDDVRWKSSAPGPAGLLSALVIFAGVLAAPSAAHAAACCLSTSTFGAGRLAVWEKAAVGANASLSSGGGLFDGDGTYHAHDDYAEREGRLTAFALLRLSNSLEAGARFPWVVGNRESGGTGETGHGPGDLAFSLRWDALPLGSFAGMPGLAFTFGAAIPTGRAADSSEKMLGADVTGRGFTTLSGGISVERSWGTFFGRLDAAALIPLAHDVAGHEVRAGPGVEIQLGGGVDMGSGVVVALAPRIRWESDMTRDGVALEESSTLELAIGPSASWDFHSHWTLQASFDTGVPLNGLGRNRPLFSSASLGLRRAIY